MMLFALAGYPQPALSKIFRWSIQVKFRRVDIHENGASARMLKFPNHTYSGGQRLWSLSNYFQEKNQMKKFAICCMALFVAAMFVPSAQAATKCYHLTNFCDQIQATQVAVGGLQKQEVVGLWDWVCLGAGGTYISGGPNKFGTRPVYPYTGTSYPYALFATANFTFVPAAGLFDLSGTFDGATAFAFQASQPFTVTKGACPLGPVKGSPALTRK